MPTKMKHYHIQKLNKIDKEWTENQIYHTDSKMNNPFVDDILLGLNDDYYRKINGEDILSYTDKKLKENNCYNEFVDFENHNKNKHSQLLEHCNEFENLACKLSKVNLQYLKWIREEIFEKIRLEINPKLPSRKRAIWICKKEELSKWLEILESSNKKIFEIKLLSGETFETDEHYCKLKNFSIEEFEENARLYWAGKLTDNPIREILFEGKFQVLETYKSFEELETAPNIGNRK